MYYRVYIMRKNGQIDEFTSPVSKDDMMEMAAVHSVPSVIMDTVREEGREVYIAREM